MYIVSMVFKMTKPAPKLTETAYNSAKEAALSQTGYIACVDPPKFSISEAMKFLKSSNCCCRSYFDILPRCYLRKISGIENFCSNVVLVSDIT